MARIVRVYLPSLCAGERSLDAAASRYLRRVHRLGPGGRFVAFDPEARLEAEGEIVGDGARVRLAEPRPASRVAGLDVSLLQGFGKGDKVDQVVRDATALGARRVIVVETERSVVRVSGERAGGRQARWRTIAIEAARQSGRGDLPEVAGPLPLAQALAAANAERRVCLDPEAAAALPEAIGSERSVALLVGPEGGLSDAELELAAAHGWSRASLGPLVLRTETAAVAALGALWALTARAAGRGGRD